MIFKGFQPNEIAFFISEKEKNTILRSVTKEEMRKSGIDSEKMSSKNLERFTNDFEFIINELFERLNIETTDIYSLMKIPEEERKDLKDLIDCTMPNNNQTEVSYRIDFLITKSNEDLDDYIGEIELPKNRIPLIPDKIYISFDKISELTYYVQNSTNISENSSIFKDKKTYYIEIDESSLKNLDFRREIEDYNGHLVYFKPENAKKFSKAISVKHLQIV